MCLTVKKNQEPQIAEQDITCYKIYRELDDKLISLYRRVETNIGTQPTVKFSKLSQFQIELSMHKDISVDYIEQGYHSFTNPQTIDDFMELRKEFYSEFSETLVIYRCTIPKGSLYYEGKFSIMVDFSPREFASYASNKLIVEQIQ